MSGRLESVVDVCPSLRLRSPEAVLGDVWALSVLDDYWTSMNSPFHAARSFAIRTYVGTAHGVFKAYPGHRTSPLYDPNSRPWGIKARRYPGLIAASPPYIDATGPVLTLSYGVGVGIINARASAVIGVDITLAKMGALLRASGCGQAFCALMDDSGFIVWHHVIADGDQGQALPSQPELSIRVQHPELAERLGLLANTHRCNDVVSRELRVFDDIDDSSTDGLVFTPQRNPCSTYLVARVPSTTLYLIHLSHELSSVTASGQVCGVLSLSKTLQVFKSYLFVC